MKSPPEQFLIVKAMGSDLISLLISVVYNLVNLYATLGKYLSFPRKAMCLRLDSPPSPRHILVNVITFQEKMRSQENTPFSSSTRYAIKNIYPYMFNRVKVKPRLQVPYFVR